MKLQRTTSQSIKLAAGICLFLASHVPSGAAELPDELIFNKGFFATIDFGEFEDAELYIVYSETDQDAQIVIAVGAEVGLRRVLLFSPHGRLFQNVRLKDDGGLGQVDLQFESPEPSLEDLQQAYPEGDYLFVAITVEGEVLVGEAELSHELLEAPIITFPAAGAEDVPVTGFAATWEAVDDVEGYRVELEDEETELAIKVDVDGDATSFIFPPGWLMPGIDYVLDVKAFGENGNRSVTDLVFTTEE